jgi:hypothetical protein
MVFAASAAYAGDLTVSRMALGAPLTIRACSQFAGAICSLTWNGKEFINAYDHGRELQSASSFDQMGECFNPTEAGSDADGVGKAASSVWMRASRGSHSIQTHSKMAFWLAPGAAYPQGCGGRPEMKQAQNVTVLSNHLLSKRVSLGDGGISNAIRYDVEFSTPEPHRSAVFEALTGYMPAEFARFWTFDAATGKLTELRDSGQGEQALPLVFSTADTRFAMGAYAPGLPQPGFPNLGYGRFRFNQNPGIPNWNTVKWNCVFRYGAIAAGKRRFRCYVVVGSLEQVRTSLVRLAGR